MSIRDLLSLYPDIRSCTDPNAANYASVVTQATRHTSRSDMSELYEIARPNEEDVYKRWRIDNRRHITVSPVLSFKMMLTRVLQASLDNISSDLYPDLSRFAYDDLMSFSLVDPNARIVEWPYNPDNPAVSPSTPVMEGGMTPSMAVMTETQIIASKNVHYADKHTFIWGAGEINLGSEKTPEMYPYYQAVDEMQYYILLPVKQKKAIVYEPVLWYIHNLERLPVAYLPGFVMPNGYRESVAWGAYSYLDEAVIALSSDQVTRIRHSQPKLVINADITCPKCNGSGTESIKGDKIVCRTCHGVGGLQNVGDFATLKLKGKNEFDRANNNPVYYVSSPQGIEYPMQVWEKLIAKAENQLCTDLLEGTGNESGIAKELRMEPRQDLLKMYGEQFCRMIADLINNRAQLRDINADEVLITPPVYYQTRSPEVLRIELQSALPGERYMQYMQLINTKYRGNDYMIQVHTVAVLYAPLLLYKPDEIDSVVNMGSYDDRDIKRRDYAVYVMGELLNDVRNVNASKRELFELADQLLIDMGVMADLIDINGDELIQTDNKLLQTVGGVTSIVEISRAVSAGEMTERSAENLLMTVFKMTKEEASSLIDIPTSTPKIIEKEVVSKKEDLPIDTGL